MTTPTNWPNPERPGYPMFPERDGWHLTIHSIVKNPTAVFWCASDQIWKVGSSKYEPAYLGDARRKYIGPALTPAQIAEMLAAERERCAKVCEDTYEKSGRDFEYLGCIDVAEQIRNLGAEP